MNVTLSGHIHFPLTHCLAKLMHVFECDCINRSLHDPLYILIEYYLLCTVLKYICIEHMSVYMCSLKMYLLACINIMFTGPSMLLPITKHSTITSTHMTSYTESPLNKFMGLSSMSCPPMKHFTTTITKTVVYAKTQTEMLIGASKPSLMGGTVSVMVVYTETPPEKLIGASKPSSVDDTVSVTTTYSESPTTGACVKEASTFFNTARLLMGALLMMTIIALVTTTVSIHMGCILRRRRAKTKSGMIYSCI